MRTENSIIVPAYNEEKRSSNFIPQLLLYVKKHIPSSEVLIVNDGSKDDTVAVVKKHIRRTKHNRSPKL